MVENEGDQEVKRTKWRSYWHNSLKLKGQKPTNPRKGSRRRERSREAIRECPVGVHGDEGVFGAGEVKHWRGEPLRVVFECGHKIGWR